MDILTIGFITVVVFFMALKVLFEWRMYRNSIYQVLYSGFIEYRMRKKSIEGMSQSYALKEEFGPHRIIYYIIDKGNTSASAFVIIFLTSGCYLISIKKDVKSDMFLEAKEFQKQNITGKLKDTVYKSLEFPTTIITVLPDSYKGGIQDANVKNELTVHRKELLGTIKELYRKSEKVLTSNDINGIFRALANDAIEDEKISVV